MTTVMHETLPQIWKRLLKQHGDGVLAPEQISTWDQMEAVPEQACEVLNSEGLAAWYVPQSLGGQLEQLPDLLQLWRLLASTDLTLAIAHGKTFLGSVCVWLAGDLEQQQRLAQQVLRGAVVSWGLTEKDHGSDLLANSLSATATADGWHLNGEKWLINNATRGEMLCLLVRTQPSGGPRGFSLFLLEKDQLPPDCWRTLPKVRTHGIRGADISGIAFKAAPLPTAALVGAQGQGLEVVLKALQLTRTACTGLSLGALDHGLALTIPFMRDRILYGRPLLQLPLARHLLGQVCAMHLASEVTALVGARAVHTLPREMSAISAIVKAAVPETVQEALGILAELLGARGFLLDQWQAGLFQKLERDHRIVPIFDGSTAVNRSSLINQFPLLARTRPHSSVERIAQTVRLDMPLPAFDPAALSLLLNDGCILIHAAPAALNMLASQAETGRLSAGLGETALAFAQALNRVVDRISRYEPVANHPPASAFELARHYEYCFMGAACVHYWLANCHHSDGTWLHAVLSWLLEQLQPTSSTNTGAVVYDALVTRLLELDQVLLSVQTIDGSNT